jgi:hypothetical protein
VTSVAAGTYVFRLISNGVVAATSATVTFAAIAPAPVLTSLDPGSVVAGGAAFTLRALGSGFTAASVVQFNGVSRATTFVSAGEVTTAVTAGEVAAAGTDYTVTVFTPPVGGLGGGTSAARVLSVVAPPAAPTITSIDPATVGAGGSGATLTVNGANYVGSSRVRVDGSERVTTFVSATQLRAALTAADLASGGTRAITVVTPAPGGGTSGAALLTVVGPTLTVDVTTAALTGPVQVTLANGPGRTGEWIGLFPTTTTGASGYVDWQWVTGGRAVSGVATAGVLTYPTAGAVTSVAAGTYVFRLISNGVVAATSATVTFAAIAPAPVLTSLNPASVLAGSGDTLVRALGSGFTSASVFEVGGVARATAFVSATEIRATFAAAELAAAATYTVTVTTPPVGGLGGGTSAGLPFNVVVPTAPTLTSINPATVSTLSGGATLTATGTDFLATSVVQVDGVARTTVFDSPTQLRATLTAADLAVAGTRAITVFTPGGGTSAPQTLTVTGPTLTLGAMSMGLTGTVTVTLAAGPGRAGDWIGLFPTSTTGTGGYVDWQWTTGGRGAPGIATANVLTYPTAGVSVPAGTYVFRLISNGAIVATSATLTVASVPPAVAGPVVVTPPNAALGSGLVTVTAGASFTDPDGDLARFRVVVTAPPGTPSTGRLGETATSTTATAGTISASVQIDTSVAATYTLSVQAFDRAGNASNVVTGTFTVP